MNVICLSLQALQEVTDGENHRALCHLVRVWNLLPLVLEKTRWVKCRCLMIISILLKLPNIYIFCIKTTQSIHNNDVIIKMVILCSFLVYLFLLRIYPPILFSNLI